MDLLTSSVKDFVAATASKEPTPGGGAIAALTAATGAALAEVVANLTFDTKSRVYSRESAFTSTSRC